MKECPICHATNGDGSETCYNCHSSLSFSAKDEEQINNENENIMSHYCKYCHTHIETDEPYDEKRGIMCKHCRRKKMGCYIVFDSIAFIIWGIITTTLKANGVLLGAIPTVIILGILLFTANCTTNAIMDNTKKKTIFKKPDTISKNDVLTQKANESEETQIKDVKETKKEKLPKKRYCTLCGGLIDNDTKKCLNCGKQYFKIKKPKFNKFVCTITIFVIIILSLAGLNVYQYINHYDYIIKTDEIKQELNDEIDNLNSTIKSNTQTINYWKGLYNSEKSLNDDNDTVSVYDNGTNLYHKFLCVDAWRMCKETDIYKKTGSISYQEYSKEEAIRLGYTPCPSCYS